MKKRILQIIALVLCCLCVFPLTSCKGAIKGDEAKEYINEFLNAIEAEDFEAAEEMLHPERPGDLEVFFANVEGKMGVDFQGGIEIEKYTGFRSSFYDSSIDGSSYELTFRAKVGDGDKVVTFTIEIVKNDNGYGIYNLELD